MTEFSPEDTGMMMTMMNIIDESVPDPGLDPEVDQAHTVTKKRISLHQYNKFSLMYTRKKNFFIDFNFA